MLVEMKHATKKYGEGEGVVYALNGVDFTLEEGEVCVVLGPSGSGKSTLLNMLGGLDCLDEGELCVNGKNLPALSKEKLTRYRKEDIGFVFQFYNLISDLTVEENIQVVSDLAEEPLPMEELLEALELTTYRHRFPRELSGGQMQRVAIARAMIKNPKLLLCDEVTGALDTKASRRVLRCIEDMNRRFHTTVVMITHNEAIAAMADRILRLKDGAVTHNEKNLQKISAEELSL